MNKKELIISLQKLSILKTSAELIRLSAQFFNITVEEMIALILKK